jgi:CBS domain-containing protein
MREDIDKLMRDPVTVKQDTELLEALRKMEEARMNDLPVVDADYKIVGELSGMEILRFAYADIRRGDEETPKLKEELLEEKHGDD